MSDMHADKKQMLTSSDDNEYLHDPSCMYCTLKCSQDFRIVDLCDVFIYFFRFDS